MNGPPREGGDEFADYVRARQEQLVRAAYLVCGDVTLADEIVQDVFGELLLRWGRAQDDQDPDAFVRPRLYRAAVTRRARRSEGSRAGPDLPPELAALSPRHRAVAVLLRYEERAEAEAAEVLGLSVSSLPRRLPPVTRDVLVDAAALVPDRDYVDRARLAAQARRRHSWRGWVGTAAAGAVLVGAVVALPDGNGRSLVPAPPSSPSASAGNVTVRWDGSAFALLGTLAQVGPSEEQLAAVPSVDDLVRGQLALPEVLSFGEHTRMRTLSELGASSAPVRAVLLRHDADGFRAVLVRPTLDDPFVLVDTLPLLPNIDEAGRATAPLEVTAVAEDRRHVLFLQPDRVVVLDAYTGELRTHPVTDRHLDQGGWTPTSVIAWSETARWRIDRRTGQVRRLSLSSFPGPHRISVENREDVRIGTYDVNGSNLSTRSGPGVLSDVWGSTFTGPGGRVATGGFLGHDAALAANQRRPERLFQGVLAVPGTDRGTPRLLVAPMSEGVSTGCCEVLGWAYRDEVLVRWRTTQLLLWNTVTGTLVRVATLPSGRGGTTPGSPAASVAIAP